MKQQFFPEELNGRFFLKTPKSKKATPLFFAVRINGKSHKFTLGTKVYPQQWNQLLQKAYISPILSNLDNQNNAITNQKIEDTKEKFNKFKMYLYTINECNIDKITVLLKKELSTMSRQKTSNKKKFDDIVKEIQETVYNDTTLKKGTSDNYIKKGLPALRTYLTYLKDTQNTIINEFNQFTTEFFNGFAKYIFDNYTYDDGSSYTISSINSILKYAKSAVILCAKNKQYLTESTISTIKMRYFSDKSSPNHIALRNDEIMLLYNYKPTCKRDEQVRDIFLLECTLGHRITDILRIDQRLEQIGNKHYITISPKKTPNKKIEVEILFDIAKKILIDKYQCKLPAITKDLINKNIKRIAQEAGITGEELQSYHYQGESEPKEFKRQRYECISSHTGRRTFVSLLVARGWNYEQISKYTGQSVKMVEHYDKATSKYIGIYKDTLKNRPNEIVYILEENEPKEKIKVQIVNSPLREPSNTKCATSHPVEKVDEIFNYIFAGDLLTGLMQKYNIIKVNEVLNKNLTKEFLDLPEVKEAVKILKDTTRISQINISLYKGNAELKKRVSQIQQIVWEIGKGLHDVLLIQFFQANVIELNINTDYYLNRVMSKEDIENFFNNWEAYKGIIISI